MKKIVLFIISLSLVLYVTSQVTGSEAERIVPGSETVTPGKYSNVPDYVRFKTGREVVYTEFEGWLKKQFNLPKGSGLKLISKDADNLGFVHYRLQQTVNGLPVEGTMYIVHTKTGLVQSMNGQVLSNNSFPARTGKIKEARALSAALKHVGAEQYKWQLPEAEKMLKETSGNPNATYYPKGELVYLPENGDLKSKRINLAYKFDIYATKPLSRNYVFVDAATGRILKMVNRIENSDVTATAITQYSGTRAITTDSYNSAYRLREAARGNGIVTLNAQTSTNIATSVDFTNVSITWDNIDPALDQYATDAHLAAESTYDFYWTNFNRNSIDNAGLKLISYVHYDVSLVNAFWDGQEMNYGDGDATSGITPLTSLEIGGHEITHGLTQYTANLNYQDESGGLDESFSDCMGVSIRQFIKQLSSVDYLIGDEIGGSSPFRSMANPKLYQQPNTYFGQYWAPAGGADNGGVHTNSGVQNYWYYLVSHGGSGTNDNGQAYHVTGIGIDKAAAITFRNLTVYLIPSSQYADARTYSIQAAIDLYGACSPEVQTVTNAWYAVGVGAAFSATVQAGFNENATTFCQPPATVYFTSSSNNATNYQWDFGDGSGSSAANPIHSYSGYGVYTVKLKVSSTCGVDSVTETQLIHVNNDAPVANNQNICVGQSATLTATATSGGISWYGTATGGVPLNTGNTYITPVLDSSITYYAETDIGAPIYSCGPANNNFGTGGFFTNVNQHSIIFNCTLPQNLLTVDAYTSDTGNRTIFLTDSAGNVLQSSTIYLASGMNTVTLNFSLPVANNMYLAISGHTYLYRNQSGAVYPYYSTDSTVILTNSDAGTNGYYYFFYNWKLQAPGCISSRTPVVVNVINTAGPFATSINNSTVNFTASTPGLSSYHWYFGDGSSSPLQDPSHTYSTSGSYTVVLIQSNGLCQDTVSQTIAVTTSGINELTGIKSFDIFPNPTSNLLNINVGIQQTSDWKLSINNTVGQTILNRDVHLTSGKNTLAVDVSSYAAGVYFISLQNGDALEMRRFIKSS